ncbi:MAG: hypothetical protein RLZZ303_1635 [Candidatus Hydrogenedentota bacterium]|jgi:hypothetical protein
MMPGNPTRRAFLLSAGAGVAALARPAAAWVGRPGLNGRFPTGHIGLGRQGAALLNGAPQLDPMAFYDVDARRIAEASPRARAGAAAMESLDALLADSDHDAVVIATPDHNLARLAMAACDAGKDVYLESPCIWMPREAAPLMAAVARSGAVLQTGDTVPYTRAGLLLKERLAALPGGASITARCLLPPNPAGGGFQFIDPPADLDWGAWLGPSHRRPYNPDYALTQWRYMLEWGGGHLRSHGTQLLATLLWALGVESPATAQVSCAGDAPASGLWDCPPRFSARIVLDERIEFLCEVDETLPPERPCAMTIEGLDAPLTLRGLGESTQLLDANGAPLAEGWDAMTPIAHWTEAMKRRSQPRLSLATACAASSLTQTAVAAWRARQTLAFDFARATVDSDYAARLLAPPATSSAR